MHALGGCSEHEKLLQAITEAQLAFSDGKDQVSVFSAFLQHCVELTNSRFGFIAEITEPPGGPPLLHIISFNTNAISLNTTCPSLELTFPFNNAISTQEPIIINKNDYNNNNNIILNKNLIFPSYFPVVTSFMGIPLFHHQSSIGVLGMADKMDDYDKTMASFLRPYALTCSTLMVGYRKASEQQSLIHLHEQSRKEAEQSAIAKAHFLSNMSHELRTPLNGIIGLTSLILDSGLTFDQREMIETVQSSGDLLLSVVNDILDLAKFEAGKLELYQTHFDIRGCVEACVDVVALSAERKGIDLLCQISEEVPITMLGDFDRVRQILTNLVGNAVKFTEKGEVVVGVKMERESILRTRRTFSGGCEEIVDDEDGYNIEDKDDTRVIHFWVRDTGIGIPRDKKDWLFKMYTQIDPYRINGTGLGLAISKGLVETMSGKIWATSEEGVGSCFHVAVPTVFSTDTTPYYPQVKGKSVAIFSHLQSHLQALQDITRQIGMSSTQHLISGDFLTSAQLQCTTNTSAVIIDSTQCETIVPQLEKYFREGRASPQTPSSRARPWGSNPPLPSPSSSSATTTPSNIFPPLMLPHATLRVAQISPLLSPTSVATAVQDMGLDHSTPLIPEPVSPPVQYPSLARSSPSPKSAIPSLTSLNIRQNPTHDVIVHDPNSTNDKKRRQRTSSEPVPVSPTRARRNTLPTKDLTSMLAATTTSLPLSNDPKSSAAPNTIPNKSKSASKAISPQLNEHTSNRSRQMQVDTSFATQTEAHVISPSPRSSPLEPLIIQALSPSKQAIKSPSSPTSKSAKQTAKSVPMLNFSHSFVKGNTILPSPRSSSNSSSANSTPTGSPVLSPSQSPATINSPGSTFTALNLISPRLNINSNISSFKYAASPNTAATASPLRVNTNLNQSNNTSTSVPISAGSVPSSPITTANCPIFLFVPRSSLAPISSLSNVHFLSKPIKFSRLSHKLHCVLEHPQSPATPSQSLRTVRSGSSSRLIMDDVIFDQSMAIVHPLTIVVGEDNLVSQVVTQRMLGKLGYTAEFYGSGDMVLSKLEGRVVDVVLLDLKMPVCDGFECARRICAALPPGHRPHIAAVTANIFQSDRNLAAAVGFNDYITKPFVLQDLAKVLSRCKRLDPVRTLPYSSVVPLPLPPSLSTSSALPSPSP